MNREDLCVGQLVWIYDVNDRRGQGPYKGEITKLGTKLVTVAAVWIGNDGVKYTGTETVFRIDSQVINDNYGHSSFATSAQREQQERQSRRDAYFRYLGIEFDICRRDVISEDDKYRLERVLREWGYESE